MNLVYRVVWNSTTNAWVVASEMAKGRKKSSSAAKVMVAVVAVGGAGLSMASGAAEASGSLTLCGPDVQTDTVYGSAGASPVTCSDKDSFLLGTNGPNYDPSLGAGVTGFANRLVLWGQQGIALTDTVYMDGNRITSLADGTSINDAVNLRQLQRTSIWASNTLGGNNAGLNPDGTLNAQTFTVNGASYDTVQKALAAASSSGADANAVHYDAADKAKATLGGNGTVLANVKGGALGTTSTEAVNGSQLFATNQNVTNVQNSVNNLTTTVNGLSGDALQWSDASSSFDASHGGSNAKIRNLDAGAVSGTSTEAVNGSQLYGTARSVADALGTTVDASGKVAASTYTVDSEEKASIKDAISALDARFDNLGPSSDSLNWNGSAYGAQRDGADQRITGVANATGDSDAVNKAQLDSAIKTVTDSSKEIVPKLKYIKFGSTSAPDAVATGASSIALGGNAFAKVDGALAIGTNASVSGLNSVAVGLGSSAIEANTFAVGSRSSLRRIVNVADGTAPTDAATVGQVDRKILEAMGSTTTSTQSQPLLKGALRSSSGSMLASATGGMLMGTASLPPAELIASGETDKAGQIQAEGRDSLAAGLNTHAVGDNAVAVGSTVATTAPEAVAVGYNIGVSGRQAVAIGSTVDALADGAIAIGNGATNVQGKNATAIGRYIEIGTTGEGAVAIGNNILATGKNSVTLGADSSDDGVASIVSVGSNTLKRRIVNVAAGTGLTDAVNFSQLRNTAQSVANALGGTDGGLNPDGTVKRPKYKVNNVTQDGVGAAIAALDVRIGEIPGAVDALKWDSDTQTYSAMHGATPTQSRISNVANGTGDYDAVNVKQLREAGLIDDGGQALNAVVYDDPTKAKVSFNKDGDAVVLSNVAEGIADLDAVNVKQLREAGLIDGGGEVRKAVLFDGANGEANAAGQKLVGLAAGTDDTDAVNVKQLRDAGLFDENGNALAVAYDDDTKGTITLAGDEGTTIAGVKAGVEDLDAVNVKQLREAGLIDDGGQALNAVVYDDPTKAKVSLNKDGDAVVLSNVAEGIADLDAVNVKQLREAGLIDGGGEVRKAVLFDGANGEANAAGQKLVGLAAGTDDGDAVNVGQLKSAGLIGDSGESLDAVVYDSATKDAITLGGPAFNAAAGTGGTKLTNVANGTDASDAVNKGQLDSAVKTISENTKEIAPKLKFVKFGATSAPDAQALGTNSVAIGGNAYAKVDGALAIGANAAANALNSVAIGIGSSATEASTFAVGSRTNKRRIVNVADGTELNDAATVGQVKTEIEKALGVATTSAQPQPLLKSALRASSGGMLLTATSSLAPDELIASGTTDKVGQIQAEGTDAIAIGINTHAVGDNAVAIGGSAAATAPEAVAVGYGIGVSGKQAVAIGSNVDALADGAVAIGNGSTNVQGVNATAIGRYIEIGMTGEGAVAIGNNILATGRNSVTLGADSADDGVANIVSVGSKTLKRKIVNVAAATQDNDAVIFSQLKGTAQSVADAIGGGSAVDAAGKISKPKYRIAGSETTGTLADAINALDARITTVGGGITESPLAVKYDGDAKDTLTLGGVDAAGKPTTAPVKLTNVAAATGDNDAVNLGQLKDAGLFDKSGELLDAVVYDKDSEKAIVTFGGGDGTVLENVAAGTVSETSRQAINGSQLHGNAQSVADALGGSSSLDADGKIKAPEYTVGGTKVTGVEAAVNGLDGRISGVAGQVGTITNNISQLQGDVLKWNGETGAGGAYAATHGAQTESRITNVADATAATDAVNKRSLDQAIANISTVADPLSVKFDSLDKAQVTLGGVDAKGKPVVAPVKLTNLADATDDTDAVNLRTLKNAGLVDTGTGETLDAVVYEAGSDRGRVMFGGVNGTVLNNVASGLITRESRQAVNGGQLFQLKEELSERITHVDNRVTNVVNNGGGSGSAAYIAANGDGVGGAPMPANAGTTPGVAVGFNTEASGDGASAIGDHATANANDSVAIGNNASVTDGGSNSVALGNGSIADAANTVSMGAAGNERTIVHVARGNADTDAATMGQVRETLTDAKAYTDSRMSDVWSGLSEDIDEVNRQANRGIAAASALINVTPYVPGHVTVNAGLANYRGETALGVGVSRWSDNGRLNLNAGVSAAQNDDPVVRVGIGYIF